MTNVNEEGTEDLEVTKAEDELGSNEEESFEESEVEVGSDSESEDGGEDGGDEGESSDEDREARKTRAQAQIERLKEENKALKEEKRKLSREKGVGATSSDMMAKAFLAATHDIKEPDAQEEALRLADKFDMSVDELMEDEDYRSHVINKQKRLIQNRKVAQNTGGAASRRKTAEYYAKYFEKNNTFPAEASVDMRDAATDILTGKTKQAWN